MNIKCLAVDNDIDNAGYYLTEWAERGVSMDRADTMTEGIEKLLADKYIFVGINGDAVDFMPLLGTMRSVTHTPIMIVTGDFTTEKEIAALDAGADLYARWHSNPEGNVSSVLAHITRLAVRSQMPTPDSKVIVYKKLLIAPLQQGVFIGNNKLYLTSKEFYVLYILMENRGCVFSTEQLYNEVWGLRFDDNAREVIRTMIKRLRQKLQVHAQSPEPDYIKNIRDVGYSFDPD